MKKYISKITFILMMAFVIGIGVGVSAKAADDGGVVGTHNLNNTDENSAKIGDQLKEPEKGWKRYDDTFKSINYIGDWIYYEYSTNKSGDNFWNNTNHETKAFRQTLRFNFTGSKLRILSCSSFDKSTDCYISIDGINYKFNTNTPTPIKQCLVFEKKDLDDREHYVEIISGSSYVYKFLLDSIDIDENGELKEYEEKQEIKVESIILNKSSINILEGKSEKLNAIVKPDNSTNKKVIWSSSDEAIATVDENGNVTAVKEGEAVVTSKLDVTDLKAECKVTVTKEEVAVDPSKPDTKGDTVLTITMTNGNIKSYNVSMKLVNDFIQWYEDRASGSSGKPFYKFDKSRSEDKIITEYIIFDKISSFQIEQNK